MLIHVGQEHGATCNGGVILQLLKYNYDLGHEYGDRLVPDL